MFDIRFLHSGAQIDPVHTALGRITIGDFEEDFEANIEFWRQSRYMHQWHDGVERLMRGESKSCLLTCVSNPERANFYFWWPMYRTNGLVLIQNQVLFPDRLEGCFDLESPYQYIPTRTIQSDDGSRISEWSTSVEDLGNWLQRKIGTHFS